MSRKVNKRGTREAGGKIGVIFILRTFGGGLRTTRDTLVPVTPLLGDILRISGVACASRDRRETPPPPQQLSTAVSSTTVVLHAPQARMPRCTSLLACTRLQQNSPTRRLCQQPAKIGPPALARRSGVDRTGPPPTAWVTGSIQAHFTTAETPALIPSSSTASCGGFLLL